MLRQLHEKYEGQLRNDQKTQRDIEKNAGGRDATVCAFVLSFERPRLAQYEQDLLRTQTKSRAKPNST